MSRRPNIKTQKVFVTVLEFENWLSKKKTDYNYEFVNGQAIKKQPMKQNEFQIVDFLIRLLASFTEIKNRHFKSLTFNCLQAKVSTTF
ncbi:MAG: hypothetical protein EAZ50_08785 [Runella slithyformis]|nr:MAG: hypothetical protein EAZ50_08785 [Runella slithyformis]